MCAVILLITKFDLSARGSVTTNGRPFPTLFSVDRHAETARARSDVSCFDNIIYQYIVIYVYIYK